MSETATDQTVTTPPEISTQTVETPLETATDSWLDTIQLESPESRKSLEKFKEPGDMAKSYLELEKTLGKKIGVPEKDDQEGWDRVYDQLGRPEKADQYDFSEIEHKEMLADPVTQNTLERFQEAAHKYGLNQRAAAGIVNEILAHSGEQAQAMQRQMESDVSELKKEFGNAFDERVGLANETMKRMVEKGGGDWQRVADKLNSSGLANDPDLVRAFGAMGQMMKQDKLWGSGGEPNNIGGRTPSEVREEIDRIQIENMDDILNQTNKGLQAQAKVDKLLNELAQN